jgi:two-component sensor histidine kinase
MTSSRTIAASLDAGLHAVAEARALVDSLQLERETERQDLRLALGELVANSVEHGAAGSDERVDVRIIVGGGVIRCEVADGGPGFPARLPASGRSGLGLIIVDGIAARWGTLRGGRSVWFELEHTAS